VIAICDMPRNPTFAQSPQRTGPEGCRPEPALEKHYSVTEIAKLWGLSENTIRRIFSNEPGVVEWGNGEDRFRRGYKTIRIPESVLQRVHRRLSKAG
jgi:hypothetical protein